jgi:hypothetical protein
MGASAFKTFHRPQEDEADEQTREFGVMVAPDGPSDALRTAHHKDDEYIGSPRVRQQEQPTPSGRDIKEQGQAQQGSSRPA